jgi:alanyl aminopeptidase
VLRWSDGRKIATQRVMLTEESQLVRLPVKPEWVMPNGGGRGYYAWSAPGGMIETLAAHSQQDLAPAERVSFLGNLNMLLDAGEVHGDSYLRALGHFGADPEPQVVASVVSSLNLVRLAFVPDSAAAAFAPYVKQTLGPALERFGYERRPGEDEAISTIRGQLLGTLARAGRDEKVAAFARDAAKRYLADSSSVDPGVVDAVLELAARKGDGALFDEFRRRYETATVPLVRRRFLTTLGAFEDPALEAKALDYMLSESVPATEGMNLMRGFAGKGEDAGERLFRWMMANYDRIAARTPPPMMRFLPMMGSGCSAERLAATKAFYSDPARAVPGVDKTLERVADMVNGCISLREREGRAVSEFLRSLGAK